jgi:hypothetical protein
MSYCSLGWPGQAARVSCNTEKNHLISRTIHPILCIHGLSVDIAILWTDKLWLMSP